MSLLDSRVTCKCSFLLFRRIPHLEQLQLFMGKLYKIKKLRFGHFHTDPKWITQGGLAEGFELKDMGQSTQVANVLWVL